MSFAVLAFPAVIWVSLSALALLLSNHWRSSVISLALQYIGVFVLAAGAWPLEMAVTKLVAGWMASAVLGVAVSEALAAKPQAWLATGETWPSSRPFRLMAACLAGLAIVSLAPKVQAWLPGISLAQAAGGLALLGLGLLHLGLTSHPLRVMMGLLTVVAGFEILYGAVESSALVAGLLAAATLGLALTGAYLLLAPTMEPE